MIKSSKNKAVINILLYWAPRVLTLFFICFLTLFSLDIFGNGYTFWQTLLGLFIHNIPSLILLIILLISWRYELVGAIGFILAGIIYIILLIPRFHVYMLTWIIAIALPAFIIGILWYLNWKKKK